MFLVVALICYVFLKIYKIRLDKRRPEYLSRETLEKQYKLAKEKEAENG